MTLPYLSCNIGSVVRNNQYKKGDDNMDYNILRQEALKEDNGRARGFYSLVTNENHRMSKDELVYIIRELSYALSTNVSEDTYSKIIQEATEELGQYYND